MNTINLAVDFRSLAFWGGIPAFAMLVKFAIDIWTRKVPATGFASFTMWTLLDCILVINTVRAGQPIWLPLGFVTGAALVTLAMWVGEWKWTRRETLAAICAAIAITFTFFAKGPLALFASVIAMTSAGIPITLDNLKEPVRGTFGLWFSTVLGCFMTYYGTPITEHSWILPLLSGIYNGFMAIIVLRRPAVQKRAAYALDSERLAAVWPRR